MVEGIAEALVIPQLFKSLQRDLKEYAVTVLNADGLNFDAFLPLFASGGLAIPVAILSDADVERLGEEASAFAQKLQQGTSTYPQVRPFFSEKTFEHELARMSDWRDWLLEALAKLHPRVATTVKDAIDKEPDDDAKATCLHKELFKDRNISKGALAQELALILETKQIEPRHVPGYIKDAAIYLGVTLPNG